MGPMPKNEGALIVEIYAEFYICEAEWKTKGKWSELISRTYWNNFFERVKEWELIWLGEIF